MAEEQERYTLTPAEAAQEAQKLVWRLAEEVQKLIEKAERVACETMRAQLRELQVKWRAYPHDDRTEGREACADDLDELLK